MRTGGLEIESANNAEPGVAADGVPQQDRRGGVDDDLCRGEVTVPDS